MQIENLGFSFPPQLPASTTPADLRDFIAIQAAALTIVALIEKSTTVPSSGDLNQMIFEIKNGFKKQ